MFCSQTNNNKYKLFERYREYKFNRKKIKNIHIKINNKDELLCKSP